MFCLVINWDMLMPPEKVTQQLDSLNLHQIITQPTRLNSNCPDKASLLDVIITNTPYMYQYGVFCSDLSYHCFIACIRLNISAKQPITISIKRSLKHFDTRALCTQELTSLLKEKNAAWRKACLSKSPIDYLNFRQLCNKATQAVRQAKYGYFKAHLNSVARFQMYYGKR